MADVPVRTEESWSALPQKQTMLELLAENGVALARLYGAYAENFPRQKDFWNTLAREESRHSQWIEKLSTGTHVPVQIKEDRFDVAVFQISFDYLWKKSWLRHSAKIFPTKTHWPQPSISKPVCSSVDTSKYLRETIRS